MADVVRQQEKIVVKSKSSSVEFVPEPLPGPKLLPDGRINISSGEDSIVDDAPSWLHAGEMLC